MLSQLQVDLLDNRPDFLGCPCHHWYHKMQGLTLNVVANALVDLLAPLVRCFLLLVLLLIWLRDLLILFKWIQLGLNLVLLLNRWQRFVLRELQLGMGIGSHQEVPELLAVWRLPTNPHRSTNVHGQRVRRRCETPPVGPSGSRSSYTRAAPLVVGNVVVVDVVLPVCQVLSIEISVADHSI